MTSASSSNRPVLIGASQLSHRNVNLETSQSPLAMSLRIAQESATASGASDPSALLRSIDTIALTAIAGWSAQNAPRLIGDALGAKPQTEWVSHHGGESALALVNGVANRIVRGESELGFVFGANNIKSLNLARTAESRLDWPMGGDGTPETVGKEGWGHNDFEADAGFDMPINIYPLFENALRVARGQSLEEHAQSMGNLMHPLTQLAAANPHAWFPTERSAQELVTTSPLNRMIFFPYAKYLNAVMATEQAAGTLIASEAFADRIGIPQDKRVYWRGGAFAVEDPWNFSERPSFDRAPAMKTCHTTALSNAGLDLEEIDLFDFYSCFPIAISMACESLGLDQTDSRGLSITGGLPYAGGPGSSYSFHSLATAVERLQAGAAKNAMVTGNGWYLTKHSASVLSLKPNSETPTAAANDDFRAPSSGEPVMLDKAPEGNATVETYTIGHGRDGSPEKGLIVGRLDSTNARFLATAPSDASLLADLETRELIGTKGNVAMRDGKAIFEPV